MSDVFSLYPHAPAPQSVKSPLDTISEAAGAVLKINEGQLVRLQTHLKSLDNLRVSLGGLLANPNTDYASVVAEVQNRQADGTITAGQAASFLAGLPKDPGQMKQYLMQHTVQAMSAYDQAQTLLGPSSLINQGGVQTPARLGSAIPGAGVPAHVTGPPLANTLGPAEAAQARTQTDITTGQPQTTPTVDVTGAAPQLSPGANLMPGSQGGAGGPPIAQPGGPSTTRATGLGTGAQIYQGDKAAAPARFQDMQNYEKIVDLTRDLETSTGPLGPTLQRIQSTLSQITGQQQPLLTSRAAAQEQLAKYLTRGQTPISAGQRDTDMSRVQAIDGSANATLTNAGNNAIALRDLGMRRLNTIAPAEFDRETDPRYMMAGPNGPVPDPEKYSTWLTQKYYPGHDWSGMVTDKMAPEQLDRVRKQAASQVTPQLVAQVKKNNPGLSDSEAKRQAGWLTPFGQSILAQRHTGAPNPSAPILGGAPGPQTSAPPSTDTLTAGSP